MTLDELHALADKFFEWPEGSGRQAVTTFSALLFAQHVLEKHGNAQAAENSVGVDALRAAMKQETEPNNPGECSECHAPVGSVCSDADCPGQGAHALWRAENQNYLDPCATCATPYQCTNTDKCAVATPHPMDFVSLLREADEIVRAKPTWRRFIDGTPLSNDIGVWMVVFAQDVLRRSQTAALRADAERYRYLLGHARRIDVAGWSISHMEQLSPRIDAAREES